MFIGLEIKKIGPKRRIVVPKDWRCVEYFVVVKDKDIKVYTLGVWVKLFDNLTEQFQIDLSSKSTKVKLDSNGRIILPKFVDFKAVKLIGMNSYFLLIESDV